jgi:hypothetical protein
MTLQPGCRFVVAPHFHMSADWPQRLLVSAGIAEADGCFFPLPSWRPPTAEQLSLLVQTPAAPTPPVELEDCVALFQLPGHLGSQWWNLLEHAPGLLGEGRLPGFESFVTQVCEFLAFKSLPVPEGARWDVVVSDCGQWLVSNGPGTNRSTGLRCNLAPRVPSPQAIEHRWARLWGGINLGDEATSVVLINLPCQKVDAELRRRFPDQPAPATVGELSERFLRAFSDYAPVRLILKPGEGYRLPRGGLILDGDRASKEEPDVLLSITLEGLTSA